MRDPDKFIERYARSRRQWEPEPDILFTYINGYNQTLCVCCDESHNSIPFTVIKNASLVDTGAYLCLSCNERISAALGDYYDDKAGEHVRMKRYVQEEKLLAVLDNSNSIISDDIAKHLLHVNPRTVDVFAGLQDHCYICCSKEYSVGYGASPDLPDSLPIPVRPSSLISGRVGICSRADCSVSATTYYNELDNRIDTSIFEKICSECTGKYYIMESEYDYREFMYKKYGGKISHVCPECAYKNLLLIERKFPSISHTIYGEPREEIPNRFVSYNCCACNQPAAIDVFFSEFTIFMHTHNDELLCTHCTGLTQWLQNGRVFKVFKNIYLELYKEDSTYSFSLFKINSGILENITINKELQSEEGMDAVSEAFHYAYREFYVE